MPAEIVSVPLAGAAAPVTLAGAAVQHAAECLTGVTISQLAEPGAPVVWGGAPSIFDMRTGTTPMGAVETAMIDLACAEVGKSLGLPTHAYLGGSDAKCVDAQAGMESGIAILLGALGGINMISGAGMLDFLGCQSAEKLVLDAEAIASARRLLDGIEARTESLAVGMFERVGLAGEVSEAVGYPQALSGRATSSLGRDGPRFAAGMGGRRQALTPSPAPARASRISSQRTGGRRSTPPRNAGSSTSWSLWPRKPAWTDCRKHDGLCRDASVARRAGRG